MFPANQPLSLRDFASLVPTSEAMRDALEHYQKTGADRPDDVRKILGNPADGVEFGPGVVHKWLASNGNQP
jgi:hypothetical protein